MQQQDPDGESAFNEACEMMFYCFYNYKFDTCYCYLSRVRELLDDFERLLDGRSAEDELEEEFIQVVTPQEEEKELNI
jgi:hypothetical protein